MLRLIGYEDLLEVHTRFKCVGLYVSRPAPHVALLRGGFLLPRSVSSMRLSVTKLVGVTFLLRNCKTRTSLWFPCAQ